MISAIVLAAGESSRMGTPKALLPVGEETFLSAVCARLSEAGVAEVVAVLGADAEHVRSFRRFAASVVVNRAYRDGQLSSLRCGLRAVAPGSRGAMVTLVDHPLVAAATYRTMREEAEKEPGMILVAAHRGRGGHPVVFPRSVFAELFAAPAGEGARAVVRADPARVRRIAFDDPGIVADIDTPEEYRDYLAAVRGEQGADRRLPPR